MEDKKEHQMRIPHDPEITSILDGFRTEDAADIDVRAFLDVANYGEYRSAVVDRLRHGDYEYAAELTSHYEAEIRTAMEERESPDVTALSLTAVAEAWHDLGTCHRWESASSSGRDAIRAFSLTIAAAETGGTVVRLASDEHFTHSPLTCTLASVLATLVEDLGVAGVDTESAVVQMYDSTVRYDDVFGPDHARAVLIAAGWLVS